MRLGGKLTIVGCAAGLALAAIAPGAGFAAAAPADAHGTLHCVIAGKVKASPPLIFGGASPSGSLLQVKIKSTSCTGTSGVSSVKGNMTFRLATNDCTALALAPLPAGQFGPVKYKGTGAKFTGSIVNFTAGGTFTATDPIMANVPGGGTSSVASGSFVGQSPTITLVINEPTTQFAANCSPKPKKGDPPVVGGKPGGLKKMSFGGASSFDVS